MADQPQIPDLLALITCDEIHRDTHSNKYSTFGIYNSIMLPGFPWTYPYFFVYMAFADSQGKVTMTILVDGDELRPPIIESDFVVFFANPNHVAETAYFAIDVVFPEPGDYRLQVWTADKLLGEKRLIVWRGSRNGYMMPSH